VVEEHPQSPYVEQDKSLREEAHEYSEDGVDLTLIRWMLSMTPSERLRTLQGFVRSIERLRSGNPNA
jgi:hypothetical protein